MHHFVAALLLRFKASVDIVEERYVNWCLNTYFLLIDIIHIAYSDDFLLPLQG